jgi:hypothetical protein
MNPDLRIITLKNARKHHDKVVPSVTYLQASTLKKERHDIKTCDRTQLDMRFYQWLANTFTSRIAPPVEAISSATTEEDPLLHVVIK